MEPEDYDAAAPKAAQEYPWRLQSAGISITPPRLRCAAIKIEGETTFALVRVEPRPRFAGLSDMLYGAAISGDPSIRIEHTFGVDDFEAFVRSVQAAANT